MRARLSSYFDALLKVTNEAECTELGGGRMTIDAASDIVTAFCHAACDRGGKIMFVGNGGSMGVATHMAIDFTKNGGMRATAFGDGAALTCVGNDFGFDEVFSRQIEWHGSEDDVLIAISSSGKSPDILNGVHVARSKGNKIVTFSGFREDNPLRKSGDVNFYIRSQEYGFVELAHQTILHGILDIDKGWKLQR